MAKIGVVPIGVHVAGCKKRQKAIGIDGRPCLAEQAHSSQVLRLQIFVHIGAKLHLGDLGLHTNLFQLARNRLNNFFTVQISARGDFQFDWFCWRPACFFQQLSCLVGVIRIGLEVWIEAEIAFRRHLAMCDFRLIVENSLDDAFLIDGVVQRLAQQLVIKRGFQRVEFDEHGARARHSARLCVTTGLDALDFGGRDRIDEIDFTGQKGCNTTCRIGNDTNDVFVEGRLFAPVFGIGFERDAVTGLDRRYHIRSARRGLCSRFVFGGPFRRQQEEHRQLVDQCRVRRAGFDLDFCRADDLDVADQREPCLDASIDSRVADAVEIPLHCFRIDLLTVVEAGVGT